jgi:hypothetical protein
MRNLVDELRVPQFIPKLILLGDPGVSVQAGAKGVNSDLS